MGGAFWYSLDTTLTDMTQRDCNAGMSKEPAILSNEKRAKSSLMKAELKSSAMISEATKGNMTNVSIAGEFIEFEQPKLSASKLAQALLNSAIDRAFSQLPQ